MKISIITPVFGKGPMTAQYINNLVNYMDSDCELILIDNNSPDNTIQIIAAAKKSFPGKNIKLFSHNKNVGFGAANNIGTAIATAPIIMYLSNDVQILGDIITPTVTFLTTDQNVMCGPHLLSFDTGWNTFKETSVIPYVEGFCMATQKRHMNMIGGFDENFFLDMEDLDLCYRLHLAGVSLAQINLPIMHTLGGSFDQLGIHRSDITIQSVNYFMQKWGLTK